MYILLFQAFAGVFDKNVHSRKRRKPPDQIRTSRQIDGCPEGQITCPDDTCAATFLDCLCESTDVCCLNGQITCDDYTCAATYSDCPYIGDNYYNYDYDGPFGDLFDFDYNCRFWLRMS